jgi:hypothetical protein
MWPGMRPATGWIAYFTSTPRSVAQFGHGVLRLRHCHAVAGHDDDVVGRPEQHGVSSRAMLCTVPFASAAAVASSSDTEPNAPKSTFRAKRFIARHMRSASRKPEVPSSVPVMIWILLISTKPIGASASPPYELSKRDHHWDVGGADRDDEQQAEDQRYRHHYVEQRGRRLRDDQVDPRAHDDPEKAQADHVLARYVIGRSRSSSWSLAAAIGLPVNVSPPTTTSKSSAVNVTRSRVQSIECRATRQSAARSLSAAGSPRRRRLPGPGRSRHGVGASTPSPRLMSKEEPPDTQRCGGSSKPQSLRLLARITTVGS